MSRAERFSLTGKTAFVTGASYGLGVGFAHALAEAGANIVLAARSVDRLNKVAQDLSGHGTKTLVQRCDVTDPATVKAAVASSWAEFGRIDILVNNAGVMADAGSLAEDLADEQFAATLATNVNGVFTCCREVGRRQLGDGLGGSIINVASIAGLGTQPNLACGYTASKAAVIHLTRTLAASWGDRGVRVNALCPGFFESEMTAGVFATPVLLESMRAMAPMGRVGLEGDLDGAIVFLASDASRFMTGTTLTIDGGISSSMGVAAGFGPGPKPS